MKNRIAKSEIAKYKKWVETYGYKKDELSILWYYNQQGKAGRDNGYYIITVRGRAYRVEEVMDQFINGSRREGK